MKIKTNNPATATLHDREVMDADYRVAFDGDGIATVREPVGTALVEKYPGIEPVEDGSGGGEPGDADDTTAGERPPDDEWAARDDGPTDDHNDTDGSDNE